MTPDLAQARTKATHEIAHEGPKLPGYNERLETAELGWDACLAHLQAQAPAWDEEAAKVVVYAWTKELGIVERHGQHTCAGVGVYMARWQHEQMSARVAVLAEERKWLMQQKAAGWPHQKEHYENAFQRQNLRIKELEAELANQCKACKELIVIGTDGCSACDTGRVTMYKQGRFCLECRR